MEKLIELINTVSRERVKRIEIIGEKSNYNSLLHKLYTGIHDQVFKTDDQAAMALYGKDANFENYKKLKYRLEKRLVNSLFFVDVKRLSFLPIQRAYYQCHKDWAAIKIMLGRTAKRSAISMAERTVRKAIFFEFTEIALDLSRILRRHYSIHHTNKKKYEYYDSLIEKYTQIMNAELIAEGYHEKLMYHLGKSRANVEELAVLAHKYSKELRELIHKWDSYKLNLFSYQVFCLRYENINDYKNVLRVCRKAIAFFKSKPQIAAKVAIFHFQIKMLYSYTSLKQYKKGEQMAQECLSLIKEGGINWYVTLESYLVLCFHTKQFQKAYEVYCLAMKHQSFNSLPPNYREIWQIYDAYIHFFIAKGQIDVSKYKGDYQPKHFRLSRFLNDVPSFSKDKRGINISILIVHILFLFSQKNYDKIINRVEAIEKYSYRYLRKNDTLRSNCFIKMLVVLINAGFHKNGTIRKSERYYERLINTPIEMFNQSSQVEIVPYEDLWRMILESIDNKFVYC